MQKNMTEESADRSDGYDEDLYDTLIAISVVAKRMAQRIVNKNEKQSSKKEET